MWYALAILLIVFISLIESAVKARKDNQIKDYVAWVKSNSPIQQSFYKTALGVCIDMIQQSVEVECRISTDDEWTYTNTILMAFQEDITDKYLHKQIEIPKLKCEISDEVFFLNFLYTFLDEHCDDHSIKGYDLLGERLYYNEIGDDEDNLCRFAEFSVSDFGIAYYKLFYIVLSHYSENLSLYPNDWMLSTKKWLKEMITKKTVLFSSRFPV